ncbi:MAG: hypothetical protein KAW93_02405, partial [Methanogenium sp.]|nr:hypothetical protein [Methanogenium sp.]
MIRKIITGLFAFLLICTLMPISASAMPGDMDGDETISEQELVNAVIQYMEARYLGKDIIHLSRNQISSVSHIYLGESDPYEDDTVIRFGTPNAVKSASFYGDYYVGIFCHLS